MDRQNLQRRNLLKGASLATLCALPVAEGIAKEYSPDTRWDETTDVLVIGFGGSGACSVCLLRSAGASLARPWNASRSSTASGKLLPQKCCRKVMASPPTLSE